MEQADSLVREAACRHRIRRKSAFTAADPGPIVLAEELRADRDLPPYDRVMMDGIAISYSDFADGSRSFERVETLVPGALPTKSLKPGQCFEVMTGAALPTGADTVIRYEDLSNREPEGAEDQTFHIREGLALEPCSAVHPKGADCREGDVVLREGQVMGAAQWAVASSMGRGRVQGWGRVRVALLATGDELVGVDETPGPLQIRASNPDAIVACLDALGCEWRQPELVGDDPSRLEAVLAEVFAHHDIIVLSGAVSAGRYDHVPEVLNRLKVKTIFHGVAQRPGKPLWFGESDHGLVFGMPGNPVSVLVCALRYLQLAVSGLQGLVRTPLKLPLAESLDLKGKGAWTRFVPVKRVPAGSRGEALRALPGATSGDLVRLAQADGVLECPPEKEFFEVGTCLPFYPFDLRGTYAAGL